jgi:hypothetical protein
MFVVRGLQFPQALVFAAIPMSVLFFSLSGRAQSMGGTPAGGNPRLQIVAQAGGVGGTIGEEKSTASPRPSPGHHVGRANRESRSTAVPMERKVSRINSDGSWSFAAAPKKGSCGFPLSMLVSVSNGSISGSGVTGSVSANGRVTAKWMFASATGQLRPSGSGSGTWQDSQGCNGSWTASR